MVEAPAGAGTPPLRGGYFQAAEGRGGIGRGERI